MSTVNHEIRLKMFTVHKTTRIFSEKKYKRIKYGFEKKKL